MFDYAPSEMKNDWDVVIEAVSQDSGSFVSTTIRKEKQFISSKQIRKLQNEQQSNLRPWVEKKRCDKRLRI